MKDLFNFILEYKERRTTGFNYEKIEEAIKNCKSSFFGNVAFIDILWTPEIYFHYSNGWSSNKPRNNGEDKKYNSISLGASTVMGIDFYAEKKLFKKDIFEGYIFWILPSKVNEDDTNCDELEKYLNKVANYETPKQTGLSPQKKIKVESFEELKKYLEEIETIVNKHNTKCEKNEPTYLYFDKDEAQQNSSSKKQQYEILSCEEEIVKLNKELEDIKRAAEASDVDLTTLMDACKEKIEYFKNKKKNIGK